MTSYLSGGHFFMLSVSSPWSPTMKTRTHTHKHTHSFTHQSILWVLEGMRFSPHLAPVAQKPHSWSPDFLFTRVQSICYTVVSITIWGEPGHAATWPKSSRDFPLGWEGDPSSSQGPIRPWRDLPSAIPHSPPLLSSSEPVHPSTRFVPPQTAQAAPTA